jgi:exopolysaccharide biosynthesis WecB/TagA/CpsF family protein
MFKDFIEVFQGPTRWANETVRPATIDGFAGFNRTKLFGFDLINASRSDVAQAIVARAESGKRTTIQFLNAHCINIAHADANYREALAKADFLLPDGSGLALAARLAGQPRGENLNGTDLFPELCREASAAGQSIFLLGGKPGIAAGAARTMRETFGRLVIVGTHHGYWNETEEDTIVALVNASGADILFVGMGVPVQEKWIARLRERLSARVVLGVGGLFDYYSGAIPRAPAAMRAMGAEWVWRLMQEPRRLAGRYLLGNARFVGHAARNAWMVRGFGEALSLKLKRAFDLISGLTALLLASPLFLLIALLIKLEDRGPIFFRQTRIGAHGASFKMWKFRSMVVDAEARLAAIQASSEREGACFKMKRDPRVTLVGSWLRRLSLDELPQLINIVEGTMSVVGPRPALPREVLCYDRRSRQRLTGTPGLTCTWQVSGRADIPFDQQVELDVEYLRGRSLIRDLSLIARTIPAVLTARGAY